MDMVCSLVSSSLQRFKSDRCKGVGSSELAAVRNGVERKIMYYSVNGKGWLVPGKNMLKIIAYLLYIYEKWVKNGQLLQLYLNLF